MTTHRLSGSKDHAFDSCLVPLRSDVELVPDEKGQPAKDGDAVHDLAASHVYGTPITVAEACKRHGGKESRVAILWENLLPWLEHETQTVGWTAELYVLWNARTGRSRRSKRGAPREPWEIPSILDLVSQVGPNTARQWDIKTGSPSYVKDTQLLAGGVAIRDLYSVEFVESGFLFVNDEGAFPMLVETLPDEMDRHAAWLESALIYLPEATPEPSKQCRFCRVRDCTPGDEFRKRLGWKRKS